MRHPKTPPSCRRVTNPRLVTPAPPVGPSPTLLFATALLSAHVGCQHGSASPQPVAQMRGVPSALLHRNSSPLLGASSKLSFPTWRPIVGVLGAVLPRDPSSPFRASPMLFATPRHPTLGVASAALPHAWSLCSSPCQNSSPKQCGLRRIRRHSPRHSPGAVSPPEGLSSPGCHRVTRQDPLVCDPVGRHRRAALTALCWLCCGGELAAIGSARWFGAEHCFSAALEAVGSAVSPSRTGGTCLRATECSAAPVSPAPCW